MSITLSNPSSSDIDTAKTKAGKRDALFNVLTAQGGEETAVGALAADATAHDEGSKILSAMRVDLNAHTGYTLDAIAADAATTAEASAVEDIIDDFLGGSHSEAMDVILEAYGNGESVEGSEISDLADDMAAFQAAQDANDEAIEKTASINTTASQSAN
jgi:hypothetical protein